MSLFCFLHYSRKNKVPREELHTFHFKVKKKEKYEKKPKVEVDLNDLPKLENYFNNLDENNRLQHEKERCDTTTNIQGCHKFSTADAAANNTQETEP